MTSLSRGEAAVVLAYVTLAAAMWPSPLLGLLHAESSAITAGAAFFASGLLATGAFRRGASPAAVALRALALAAVPGLLLTGSLIWRANCGYMQGATLYVLFVPASVLLAVSVAWVLSADGMRRPGMAFVAVGVLLATVPVVLGPGLHPQFYSYNPVWGGVLGPIYDEELTIRPGLLAHRALVLAWAASLFALGEWLRTRRLARTGAVLAACIGAAYLLAPRLGIVTTYGEIERALGASERHGPFILHYDATALPAESVRFAGETLGFRHAVFAAALEVVPDGPVHVYLYPDERTRGALTGARRTSITPTWLRRPQMHLLQQAATPDNLAHELAHVFAREFGAPLIHASPAVGLVEGLAVALEPPAGLPTPAEQVAAARALAPDDVGRLAGGPADAVAAAMGPFGFWTGRGAVSYVTAGAFAGWLLDRYGPGAFRRAYATGRFESAYGRSAGALAGEWAAELRGTPVSEDALALAAWRFSRPSLLETRCPHHVPRHERLTRRAAESMVAGDAASALRLYERALTIRPDHAPALAGWAAAAIGSGQPPGRIVARLRGADTTDALVATLTGDALQLVGDPAGAVAAYARALALLPPFAHAAREELVLHQRLAPAAIRHVYAADAAGAAAALEAQAAAGSSVAWRFAASRWLEAGLPRRALAAVTRSTPPGHAAGRAALLAAFARVARLAGRPADAARAAAASAAEWRAAGVPAAAREQDDRAAEARWVALLSRTQRR